MNILFIHHNFPAQFKWLAPALVNAGHTVVAMTLNKSTDASFKGVRLIYYGVSRVTTLNAHPWAIDFETKVIRAEACFKKALEIKAEGFSPDVIIAHPGWGESLFLKDVWPAARLGIYCEFYYHARGVDMGFDPEFGEGDPTDVCKIRLKNLNNLLHFEVADAGLSPTHWQASTFPEPFRDKISVIHDGIDTDALVPNPAVSLTLNGNIVLTKVDEVVTFVNRNLEPYRGYHIFMRALPEILKRRPKAHILIVGGDDVSYGCRPTKEVHGGDNWKSIYAAEMRPKISDADWKRVHFLGGIPYNVFIPMLQLSSVHVYLTYPFVLSWSLLEAMSVGCAIVASDTQPLHEAITHDVTGRLVNFFDVPRLANEVCNLLEDLPARKRLGDAAREFACAHYDLKTVCLPKQLAWVDALASRPV